jgi:hypothetical protein
VRFFLLSGFWSDLTFSRLKQVQISYKSSFATFRHYLAHAFNHTTQLPPQLTPKPKQTGLVLLSASITSLVRSSLMNFRISMSSSDVLFSSLYLPLVIKLLSYQFNDDLTDYQRCVGLRNKLFCSAIDHRYSVYWVGGIPLSLYFGFRVFF